MSKESYARGFCKAAAAAGVDPEKLVKMAWGGVKHIAKTNSNPSYEDVKNLASVDLDALPDSVKSMTASDYLDAMKIVNPEMSAYLRGLGESSGNLENPSMPIFDEAKEFKVALNDDSFSKDKYDRMMKGDTPLKDLFVTNYATATNLLDRVQKQTGRPIWDVKNVRPVKKVQASR